jgi:endothelin-converting enzyme
MRTFLGHTSISVRKPWENFAKILAGIDPNVKKDRWKTCVREMDNTLGFLAGEFYVRKTFGGDAKERGRLVIEQIKDAFVERFAELEWVDEETREVAVRKVKNLRVKVGYNDASPNMTDPIDLARYAPCLERFDGIGIMRKLGLRRGLFLRIFSVLLNGLLRSRFRRWDSLLTRKNGE